MSADPTSSASPASEGWARAAALLWPGAGASWATRKQRPSEPVLREFLAVPSARRPRLLLPIGAPRAATAALRRYSHDLGAAERTVRHLASSALATGLPERVFRDVLRITAPAPAGGDTGSVEGSVEDHLSELLGRPVVVSLGLGTARANRKPVLHVLTPEGETVAFVKVGDSDVASELVRGEAAALSYLGTRPLTHLAVPQVVHHGRWRGAELLILSALPTTARRWQRRDALPVDAMAELFAVDSVRRRAVGDSAYWRGIVETGNRLADRETARLLSAATARIGGTYGDVAVDFGAWHGDWTPWNMAWRRGTVQLWDWERFARGVPRGFDALHYRLQDALRSARPSRTAPPHLPSLTAGAERALAPFGVSGRTARATTACYLLDLCCRYQLAAQSSSGAPLRPLAEWLLGAVHDNASRL